MEKVRWTHNQNMDSTYTPVLVPPVTIHAPVSAAVFTSPFLNWTLNSRSSWKSNAPPVTEIMILGSFIPQRLRNRSRIVAGSVSSLSLIY